MSIRLVMRRVLVQPGIVALCAIAGQPSLAAEDSGTPLNGQAIKVMVPGSIINLDTPIGTVIPVTYAEDGTMTGKAGAVGWYLGAAEDKGRWWVADEKLCHKWHIWFDAEPSCLDLRRSGKKLSWRRDDGKSGTATLETPRDTRLAAAGVAQPIGLGAAYVPMSAEPQKEPAIVASPKPRAASVVAIAPRAAPKSTPVVAAVKVMPAAFPSMRILTYTVVGVTPGDALNVRNGPSPLAPAIGAIAPGGRGIRLTGACITFWCPIAHGSSTGWVNRSYIALEMALNEAGK